VRTNALTLPLEHSVGADHGLKTAKSSGKDKMKKLASNTEWKKWGEADPLFGVASWAGKEKQGTNPWSDADFYKLGEFDWKDFKKHWESYGVDNESCLEIGCGAGRITMQLAGYFKAVHAIDISEHMIEYAKTHIDNSSVQFHVSTGIDIPIGDQSVASVFSAHVFQHLDSLSVARRYFLDVSRVIKPNGTLMVHLPIYKWPAMAGVFGKIYAFRKQFGDAHAAIKRILMDVGLSPPIMRGLSYPIEFFYEELPKMGFDDIEINIFVTKSNNDPHPFVFARKKV
jgi:2-polyprenyl-3-methyl-5-hydroxy-6-metoxy-1,4-benzoquinol methylase